jgi:hypothetical protein
MSLKSITQILSILFLSFGYMVFIYENTQELQMKDISQDRLVKQSILGDGLLRSSGN